MIQHNLITYEIEAMQPTWLGAEKQRRFYECVVGLIGGLLFGLSKEIEMVDRLTWSWTKARPGLIFGLILG